MKVRNATHQTHLPSSFSPDEVERLLAVVDRDSPLGKRDYAILSLAAKLGLRSGDIRALRFEHIDWENNTIRFVQNKTGEPLSLPLLPDVGWAIIDYIQHGRPVSDTPEIFVRQVPPHVPMRYYDSLMVKYLQKANISTERVRHHGLHALRHSLATTLLEQETPIHVIQEVLGHLDSNTTQRYISVDVEQLKSCAMEVPYAAGI
jgi:integrase